MEEKITRTPYIYSFWIQTLRCKGPIIIVIRVGTDFKPRRSTNITLIAYYNTIDYLDYYRDIIRSIIDKPGRHYYLSKATQYKPQIVKVAVPKMHPLFNLESDNLCDISLLFGLELVAKVYNSNCRDGGDSYLLSDANLVNPLV
ncbi:hypothetical protein EDB80DRAFT_747054 [Ilyonectria destructans]|nr:hypothetical protein EDB80DRAFT_747054 [Ilyonectria destructans]